MELLINKKIIEIVEYVNEMIPEEWDEFYVNGDINGEEGGIFFYYRINDEWIYSHDMYEIYEGYSNEQYEEDWYQLFDIAVELQQIFRDHDQPIWSNVILHVDENMKLTTEFDYADWSNTERYGMPSLYLAFFKYFYLGINPTRFTIEELNEMKAFKERENSKIN
ncbi:antitoxin YezG family protein [Macrococcus capreoli]|uniref:antitoxin YezG family protein n=1 Tax=Macrococcus capreoli TaxID=2982690 RepID=UPI0021D5F035|nr:antitoxin YezG family protein [Macrococcus sp. TMW 2.2395]MCU7558154.1 antitoxin YezG family protein [Macrococcus sp. TMW 2.2395]